MIIRSRNSFWMIIIQSRNERTNYKVVSLKILMNRRWHMYSSSNRFKIVNRKCIRIKISIPTHNIEWMSCINKRINFSFFLYFDDKFTFLIDRFSVFRQLHIALTERRVFQKLTIMISISFRSFYRRKRFDIKQTILFRIKFKLINRSSWNNYIITRYEFYISNI